MAPRPRRDRAAMNIPGLNEVPQGLGYLILKGARFAFVTRDILP